MRRTWLALLLLVTFAACGPRATQAHRGAGALPAPVERYVGLRWVPADATYVVATRRVDDAVAAARALVEAAGIVGDFDADELGREMARELGGLDLLSTASLADHGVDLARGAAMFSRGLSPTIAVPLADPQRLVAFIDEQRGHGAVVQVGRAHDLDVYTFRGGHEITIHWAIADDWLLGHVELVAEHEPDGAWLDAALAARGGFGAEPDLTEALGEGQRRLGAEAPVVAIARVPPLLAHPLVTEPAACAATVGKLARVILVGGVTGRAARGVVVAEVQGGLDDVRALRTPAPAGWGVARAEAPIQAEVGLDLRAVAERVGPCVDANLVRDFELDKVRAARGFIYRLDPARMEGRAAVAAVVDPGLVDQVLDDIPGRSFLERVHAVGAVDVHDLDVPMGPQLAYARLGTTTVVGLGGTVDPLVAGGLGGPDDELGRLRLRPQALSVGEWTQLLAPVIGRDRARDRMIRRLRRWRLGEVVVTIDRTALVVAATGER